MAIKTITYTKDIQLSPHFALHEFRCKSGSKMVKYSEETIALLEKIFEIYGNVGKAIITSGYRTPDYSVKVGGTRTDGHTVGIAVDIKWYDKNNNLISPKYIACVAQDVGFTGIGIMKNSIHLDTRTTANYKNGKWWGDETNGKNGIVDFYVYFGLEHKSVDTVLGRNIVTQAEPKKVTEKVEVSNIEQSNAETDESAENLVKENANVIVKFFSFFVKLIKKFLGE